MPYPLTYNSIAELEASIKDCSFCDTLNSLGHHIPEEDMLMTYPGTPTVTKKHDIIISERAAAQSISADELKAGVVKEIPVLMEVDKSINYDINEGRITLYDIEKVNLPPETYAKAKNIGGLGFGPYLDKSNYKMDIDKDGNGECPIGYIMEDGQPKYAIVYELEK